MSRHYTNILVPSSVNVKSSEQIHERAIAEVAQEDPANAKEILAKNEIKYENKKATNGSK